MKYAVVKLENNGTVSYNLGAFNKEENVIAFPLESLQVEMMRLKYYLEKAKEMTENTQKSHVKDKKREIKKAKNELEKASEIINSLMTFQSQTTIKNFEWPEIVINSKRRRYKDKNDVPALMGIS